MKMLKVPASVQGPQMTKMSQESDEIRQQDSKQTTCWKCGLVCKSKQGLSVHQNKCLSNAVKGTSFFQYERLDLNSAPPRKPKSQSGKVIPPSQPLIDSTQEVDERPLEQGEVPVTVDKPPEENNPSEKKEGRQQTAAKANVSTPQEDGITSSIRPDVPIPVGDFVALKTTDINLPAFTPVMQTPDKAYNGIEGTDLVEIVSEIYNDMVRWKKNLFQLPSGKAGKELIKLLTTWLRNYNEETTYQSIALKVVMILPNLLLQKPSATSKSKDHVKSLELRIQMWNEGRIRELWNDSNVIQNKMTSKSQKSPDDVTRIFTKLMFEGKPGAAMKFLDENSSNSVLKPTVEVIEKLQSLHPEAAQVLPNSLYQGERFFACTLQQHHGADNFQSCSSNPWLGRSVPTRRETVETNFDQQSKQKEKNFANN